MTNVLTTTAMRAHWAAPVLARGFALAAVAAAVVSAVGARGDIAGPAVVAVWLITTALVGSVVAARRPSNAVGWILLAVATLLAIHAAASTYVAAGHREGIVAWLWEWLSIPGFGLLLYVPLLFPTGATPSRRWRILGWIAAGAIAALTIATALRPSQMGVYGPNALGWDVGAAWLESAGNIASGVIGACGIAAVASLVLRLRRAAALERQQIRWLLSASAVMAGGLMFAAVSPQQVNELSFYAAMAGLMAVPVAIGVAILEYHLWDLDRVINRTVVYVALTLILGAVYVGTVVALAGVLDRLAGLAASVAATVLVALLVLPLRDWLQRLVSRLLYGDRADPYRALNRLGAELETAVGADDAPRRVVSTVASALRLPYVALELDGADGPHVVAVAGSDPGTTSAVPVVVNGEVIGRLVVDAGGPQRSRDQELLTALARQAGPALHAARLTAELRWSQERIVVAREEERRRLRADLHDGIGSRLAGLTLGLEAVDNLLQTDPAGAQDAVAGLRRRSQEAVAEVREVVAGLRPPSLDELGLVGAVRARAAELTEGVEIDVRVEGELGQLSAAAEVALYRIAVESLTNVVRHAAAQHCVVTLSRTPMTVTLRIDDDGSGIVSGGAGFGLASMRQRAAELGGTFDVVAGAPRGTSVKVSLPADPPRGGA